MFPLVYLYEDWNLFIECATVCTLFFAFFVLILLLFLAVICIFVLANRGLPEERSDGNVGWWNRHKPKV